MSSNRTRSVTLLLITVNIIFTYLMGIAVQFPYRATNDETYVFPDLHALLTNGHLEQANYFSGIGYQLITTILVRITGIDLVHLQLLNPILATFVFGVLILVCYLVYRQTAVHPIWWGFAAVPPSFFVFGGYVNRIRESTHKGYTQLLLFVGIYLAYRIFREHRRQTGTDYRMYALLLVVSGAITVLNYVWGFVYAVLFSALLLHHRSLRLRSAAVSTAMYLITILTPSVHPAVRIHDRFKTVPDLVFGIIQQYISLNHMPPGGASREESSNTTSQGTTQDDASQAGVFVEPSDRISEWPTVSIPGTDYSITTWFIYTLGIFAVALLTFLSAVHLVMRYYYRRTLSDTNRLFLVIWTYFGVFGAGLILIENINTFRRIIVVPGVFGVLYWTITLADRGRPNPALDRLPVQRETLLKFLIGFLLITSVLAANRTLLDGGSSPYDIYADKHEVEKFQWIDSHTQEIERETSCIRTHQRIDGHLSAKILGSRLRPEPIRPSASKIYSSGDRGRVSCIDRS